MLKVDKKKFLLFLIPQVEKALNTSSKLRSLKDTTKALTLSFLTIRLPKKLSSIPIH